MALDNDKFVGEGLTYDDVLLVPAYSNVLPRETDLRTKFTRNIQLNVCDGIAHGYCHRPGRWHRSAA